MENFLAGILFAMAFWGIIASHIGDKITNNPDDKEGTHITKMFLGAYILVIAVLTGTMMGALLL